ncbi:MAG TPA: DUF1329 domain-containing protein [Solimonas sp.]|nr:DUF1329 domain-containing protein [Solimonas sp.]
MLLAAALVVAAGPAGAAARPQDVARLGQDLTPVGAERAGSRGTTPAEQSRSRAPKDEFEVAEDPPATIPAWQARPELPSADEKPLFVINWTNMNRYRDQLTESHAWLLQAYPNTYVMNVYPSRRTVAWPQAIDEATKRNAASCKLSGSDDLAGCRLGFPFPVPANGAEVLWNHKLRWRGDAQSRRVQQLAVQPTGSFQVLELAEDYQAVYANLQAPGSLEGERRELSRSLTQTLAPPRIAGAVVLVHERSGLGSLGRAAWTFTPGTRLPRREPKICCDRTSPGSDGMQFFDQLDLFNGALEAYDWKLVGKREVFVPYNARRLAAAAMRHADLVRPTHMNQELLRYELHRVWVVDAQLRAGGQHAMRKRRFYLDEDSWTILAADALDAYDQPYQLQEGHLVVGKPGAAPRYAAEVIYQLSSGRYLIAGLQDPARAEDPPPAFTAAHFSAEAMKKYAARP